jgi:C1A family cysteine protease
VKTREFKGFILGWHPDKPDGRDLVRAAVSPNAAAKLPVIQSLTPGMPPIWNQGQQGSCTSFMFARLVDRERREQKIVTEPPSMALDYALSRFEQGTFPEDSGASIRGAVKVGNKYGYVLLSDFPYSDKICDKFPSNDVLAKAAKNKITAYHRVNQTADDLRGVLMADPIGFGFNVYDNFEPSAEGIVPAAPKGKRRGGHAVTIVGYDHKRALFECDNQWGIKWGLKGRFWMPYEYMLGKECSDFWTITMVPTADRKLVDEVMGREDARIKGRTTKRSA